ncbi:hypothetical protein D5R93_11635 [Actinomyces lilanjuaniae]|uniref:Uncharacterized protein n=1 Tax=Actinomyces lilanjuaniae TaxID=2321394 RepID=A0ABN5PTM6_9ACTO|nr:hypothetical protein D5R93_11635 [Actinomyces lilanjuaniae]
MTPWEFMSTASCRRVRSSSATPCRWTTAAPHPAPAPTETGPPAPAPPTTAPTHAPPPPGSVFHSTDPTTGSPTRFTLRAATCNRSVSAIAAHDSSPTT